MTLALDATTARHLARAAEALQSTPEEVALRLLRLLLASCDAAATPAARYRALYELSDWREDVMAATREGS